MKTKITNLRLVLSIVAQSFLVTAFSQNVAKVTQPAEMPEIVVQKGYHGDMDFSLSPDGKYLAEPGKYIAIYDTETGIEIRQIWNDKPGIQFYRIVFSPNSKYVAAFDYMSFYPFTELTTVSVFEVQTGKRVAQVDMGFRGYLCFSKDNRSLYNILSNIKKWDFLTGELSGYYEVETLSRNQYNDLERIGSFCYNADFKRVAVGTRERIIINNTYENSTQMGKIKINTEGLAAGLAFSKDNKTLHCMINNYPKKPYYLAIDATNGSIIKRIDYKNGRQFFKEATNVSSEEWIILDDKFTATNGEENTKYYLANIFTGKIDSSALEIAPKGEHYLAVALTYNGRRVFSRRGNRLITQFDFDQGRIVRNYAQQNTSGIREIEFTADGKYVIFSQEKEVKPGDDSEASAFVWDVKNIKQIAAYRFSTPEMIAKAKDGEHFSDIYPEVFVPRINTGKFIVSIKPPKEAESIYTMIDFKNGTKENKNANYLHSHSLDGKYWVVNLEKGDSDDSNPKRVSNDNSAYSALSFEYSKPYSRSNRGALSSNYGIQVIDKQSKQTVLKKYYKNEIFNSAFSPDGKYLVVTYSPKPYNMGDYHVNRSAWIDVFSTENWQILINQQISDKAEYNGRFSPDGKYFATKTGDSYISLFDAKSWQFIRKFEDGYMYSTKFDFSPDGKLLVTGGKDCKVTFYDVETGKVIYSAINMLPNKWIAFTPDNYFDSHIDEKTAAAAVFKGKGITVDQMAVWYNRPDVLLERIGNEDKALIEHYKRKYLTRLRKLGIDPNTKLSNFNFPIAEIASQKVEGKTATLNLKFSSGAIPVKSYNIYVNDVPLFGNKGKTIVGAVKPITEKIELAAGSNKIEVSCMNKSGLESFRALTYATYSETAKKDMYFLAFGISKYNDPKLNLAYADKDAIDLSKVIETFKGKGFENVYTKVLTNEQVTPAAIKAAKDFVKNAKPDDTFILFIAGHGMHDKDAEATYYYLTSNADVNNLKATAADFETIEDLLQGIPPRNKLFLMDACESGEIDEDELETLQGFKTLEGLGIGSRGFKSTTSQTTNNNQPSTKRSYLYQKDRYIYNDLVRRSGAIVFSSSKGGELSYERSDIENGLFTEYIMKALTTTEADKDGNGTVSTDELRQYVSEQVAKASGDLQHPTVDRDNIYQKFGFGVQ